MQHSLFGDSGLGMDLGSLMSGPPAEDQLLPDITAQLFDDMAAAAAAAAQNQEAPPPPAPAPEGGECALCVVDGWEWFVFVLCLWSGMPVSIGWLVGWCLGDSPLGVVER